MSNFINEIFEVEKNLSETRKKNNQRNLLIISIYVKYCQKLDENQLSF